MYQVIVRGKTYHIQAPVALPISASGLSTVAVLVGVNLVDELNPSSAKDESNSICWCSGSFAACILLAGWE